MKVQNKKIPLGEFMEEREEVLATWPTGKDVDLEDAIDYLKNFLTIRILQKNLKMQS